MVVWGGGGYGQRIWPEDMASGGYGEVEDMARWRIWPDGGLGR